MHMNKPLTNDMRFIKYSVFPYKTVDLKLNHLSGNKIWGSKDGRRLQALEVVQREVWASIREAYRPEDFSVPHQFQHPSRTRIEMRMLPSSKPGS
ncbi:Zinc finger protein 77 [Manis javanica]|nr:Zinc finger protein 77 [Manis javanica]